MLPESGMASLMRALTIVQKPATMQHLAAMRKVLMQVEPIMREKASFMREKACIMQKEATMDSFFQEGGINGFTQEGEITVT